jgi:hypothetical protein
LGQGWSGGSATVALQHEQRNGSAGSLGHPDAEMQPADVQSMADEQARTRFRWEALDRQPKGLPGSHTHATPIQPLRKNHGPRKPGYRQTGEGA